MSKTKPTKTEASKAVKNAVQAYGSKITNMSLVRTNAGMDDMVLRWKTGLKNIDHFNVDWEYFDTKSNRWLQGNSGTKEVKPTSKAGGYYEDEFTLPSSNTVNVVRARVRAVAKTHDVSYTYYDKKGKKKNATVNVSYWTAAVTDWSAYDFSAKVRPAVPPAPTAKLNGQGNGVTISWGSFQRPTTCIVINRYADNGMAPGMGKRVAPNDQPDGNGKPLHRPASVFQNQAGSSFVDLSIAPGHRYRYMLMAHNYDAAKGSTYSYSQSDSELVNANKTAWWFQNVLSDEVQTKPLDPSGLAVSFYGMSGDKARMLVSWKDNGYAGESYEVRWAESLDLLKKAGGYESENCSGLDFTGGGAAKSYIVTVEAGKAWWFRVVVKNSNAGALGYSDFGSYRSCVAGCKPDPPTPGPCEPSCVVGDKVAVSWTHNSADTSAQTAAEVRYGRGGSWTAISVAGATSSALIPTSAFSDGDSLAWQVRTKGVVNAWSNWSEQVRVTVYAPPTCYIQASYPTSSGPARLSDGGTIGQLPLSVTLTAGGVHIQKPVAWYLDVVAAEDFQYTAGDGTWAVMRAGETMLQATVDASDPDFSASSQLVSVTAADGAFVSGQSYYLRAGVLTDAGLRSDEAYLGFSCEWEYELPDPSVDGSFNGDDYTMNVVMGCWREVPGDEGGEEGVAEYEPVPDVTLDLYRISYDGELVELATDVPNGDGVLVIDPYPCFGECSYRVVANDPHTDAVSVFDSTPIPVPANGILIQWDDERYEGRDEETGEQSYVGEQAFLPYDIEVTEDADPDRELAEYIGRRHPVPYFGTQLGVTGRWSSDLVKWEDADLLRQLRKLQRWQGTCYVRETSGAGYRAIANVSFTRSYDSLKQPVTIDLTRVEDE